MVVWGKLRCYRYLRFIEETDFWFCRSSVPVGDSRGATIPRGNLSDFNIGMGNKDVLPLLFLSVC